MFHHFFSDYKYILSQNDSQKRAFKNFNIIQKILGLIIIAVSTASGVFAIIDFPLISIICMSILLPLCFALEYFSKKQNNKMRGVLTEAYRKGRIDPLIKLLESYTLHTHSGIEWLIYCCQKAKKENPFIEAWHFIKKFSTVFAVPVIAFFAAIMAQSAPTTQLINISLFSLIGLVICFAISFAIFAISPGRLLLSKYNALEDDLRYIQTQLPT